MDITDSPIKSPKSPRSPSYETDCDQREGSTTEVANGNSVSAGSGGSLFVGKLAFDCRTRELEELFGKYGRITRCDIKRGYAFVEFEDERDATDAIKYLDGTRFLGLNITVERTKGEKRNTTNPDGTKSRDCFKCGRVGHYARECRNGGGRVDRYERRGDRYDRRDDRRSDRYGRDYRRERSRSPRRERSRSPRRSVSRSPARY